MVVQPTGIWWTVPIFKVKYIVLQNYLHNFLGYMYSDPPILCITLCSLLPLCVTSLREIPGMSILFCKVQAKLNLLKADSEV